MGNPDRISDPKSAVTNQKSTHDLKITTQKNREERPGNARKRERGRPSRARFFAPHPPSYAPKIRGLTTFHQSLSALDSPRYFQRYLAFSCVLQGPLSLSVYLQKANFLYDKETPSYPAYSNTSSSTTTQSLTTIAPHLLSKT